MNKQYGQVNMFDRPPYSGNGSLECVPDAVSTIKAGGDASFMAPRTLEVLP
jgi:hypothetical protein